MLRGAGGTTKHEQRGGKDGPLGTVADLDLEFAEGISRFYGAMVVPTGIAPALPT